MADLIKQDTVAFRIACFHVFITNFFLLCFKNNVLLQSEVNFLPFYTLTLFCTILPHSLFSLHHLLFSSRLQLAIASGSYIISEPYKFHCLLFIRIGRKSFAIHCLARVCVITFMFGNNIIWFVDTERLCFILLHVKKGRKL